MTKPHKELRDYLEKLISRHLYVQSLRDQLKLIDEWNTPKRAIALNQGAHFYSLVQFAFTSTILLEVCKLLSNSEERSLPDFLQKVYDHATAIGPMRYDAGLGDRVALPPAAYRSIAQRHPADKRHPQALNARTMEPCQPGIGPHSESATVDLVAAELQSFEFPLTGALRPSV